MQKLLRAARPMLLVLGGSVALVVGGCSTYRTPVGSTNPTPPGGQYIYYPTVVSQVAPVNGVQQAGLATLIDASGDTVTSQVTIAVNPFFVAIDGTFGNEAFTLSYAGPNGEPGYAGSLNSFGLNATLQTANVQTSTLPTGAEPNSVFYSSFNIYVSQPGMSSIAIYSAKSTPPALSTTIPLNAPANAFTGITSGQRIYAIQSAANTATAIETATNNVSAVLPTGADPVFGVMSPDSRRTFIVNKGDGTVTAIDSQNNEVLATWPVGTAPIWADYYNQGSVLAVANSGSDSVSVINASEDSPNFGETTDVGLPVGSDPVGIAVLQDGTRAYTANNGTDSVSIVNLVSMAVTSTLTIPNPLSTSGGLLQPFLITATADLVQPKVYVLCIDPTTGQSSPYVTIINPITDTITAQLPVQGLPIYMTAPPAR
jgi:YVTN family beta-propeller protein